VTTGSDPRSRRPVATYHDRPSLIMADRDTYEKENTAADTWGIRLYIGILLFVGGLLTVYQSTTGTEAPFWVGVAVTVGSAVYVGRLLRAAI
jgi:hypothetical protein